MEQQGVEAKIKNNLPGANLSNTLFFKVNIGDVLPVIGGRLRRQRKWSLIARITS